MNAPFPGVGLQDGGIIQNILSGNGFSAASIIAHAGGLQPAATPIPPSAAIVVLGTVASAGDSAVLPFAQPGETVLVFNSTVTSANIFGQVAVNKLTGVIDTINGTAGSTAYAIGGGVSVLFFCGLNGAWAALKSA